MARRANPRVIGAFVIGAAALAVLAIVVLGSSGLFRKTHEYALFFQEDVNGLRVGAPVKFKGVDVGSVTRILLNINLSRRVANASTIRIPVIISLEQGRLLSRGAQIDLNDPMVLQRMIDMGLRAQLATESFVTGILYIDLDMHPGTPVGPLLPPGSPYQEIPTIPTALQQAQSALTRLVSQANEVDFRKLAGSIGETLLAIKELVTSPQLKSAVNNLDKTALSLNRTAQSVQHLAHSMNQEIPPLTASVRAGTRSADATLKQARATLVTMQTVLDQNSPLVYQTGQTLEDLSAAARSVKQLADYLQRNPGSVVRGRYYGAR